MVWWSSGCSRRPTWAAEVNAQTELHLLAGPSGALEVAIDRPEAPASGCAVIAHPHPLHGGTLTNKVVQTLARAAVLAGLNVDFTQALIFAFALRHFAASVSHSGAAIGATPPAPGSAGLQA